MGLPSLTSGEDEIVRTWKHKQPGKKDQCFTSLPFFARLMHFPQPRNDGSRRDGDGLGKTQGMLQDFLQLGATRYILLFSGLPSLTTKDSRGRD